MVCGYSVPPVEPCPGLTVDPGSSEARKKGTNRWGSRMFPIDRPSPNSFLPHSTAFSSIHKQNGSFLLFTPPLLFSSSLCIRAYRSSRDSVLHIVATYLTSFLHAFLALGSLHLLFSSAATNLHSRLYVPLFLLGWFNESSVHTHGI